MAPAISSMLSDARDVAEGAIFRVRSYDRLHPARRVRGAR